MVGKNEVMQGIINYIDNEVIPELPTAGKWGMGTIVVLASNKYEQIYDQLASNDYVKMLGITDGEKVDVDCLSEALKKSAEKYGKLEVSFPLIGTMRFSAGDIDKLAKYINGGK